MSFLMRFVVASGPQGPKQNQEGENRLDEILRDLLRGCPDAISELRRILSKGLSWFLQREIAGCRNVDQLVVKVVDDVVAALQSRRLTSVEEILSFSRSAAIAQRDEAGCSSFDKQLPAPVKRRVKAMKLAITELSTTDREAINRYVQGEKPASICSDLAMTLSEFASLRVWLKSRADQHSEVLDSLPEKGLTGWVRAHIA